MSAFLTCCGFYCAFTALIGVYFFIVIAIMEARKNPYLTYEYNSPAQGYHDKMVAFLIVAAIEVVLCVLCFWCGRSSMESDRKKAEMEQEMKARQGGANYQQIGQMEQ